MAAASLEGGVLEPLLACIIVASATMVVVVVRETRWWGRGGRGSTAVRHLLLV